jgi:hypothetical protein
MAELSDIVKLLVAGGLAGFGVGLLASPVFMMMLAPGVINPIVDLIGAAIVAAPCVIIAGWIWKRVGDRDGLNDFYGVTILGVALVTIFVKVTFYM